MINDAYLASNTSDYKKLGLQKNVEIWEDGMRTTGDKNSFEWWYFDGEFKNGYKIVVIFYTKNRFDVKSHGHPMVSIDITLPDGNSIYKLYTLDKNTILNGSKERCDLTIGQCSVQYLNENYSLNYIDDEIEYKICMEPTTPMWRPDTGHIFFKNKFFAWLVAIPSSKITGTLKINDELVSLNGVGYHDHNWGNEDMSKLIDSWYWYRTTIDSYTVILFDIVAKDKFNSVELPLTLICKDNNIINDSITSISINKLDTVLNFITKKKIHNKVTLDLTEDNNRSFSFIFERDHDIQAGNLLQAFGSTTLDNLLSFLKLKNPTYVRSVGLVTLALNNIVLCDTEALWEQMDFNKKNLQFSIAD